MFFFSAVHENRVNQDVNRAISGCADVSGKGGGNQLKQKLSIAVK